MFLRFDVMPLCPEILSIKNSPALRAATSTGSILDEESYLNSQRLETVKRQVYSVAEVSEANK
jgi:hypothetical protein